MLSTSVTAIASTNTLPAHASSATTIATGVARRRDADRHEQVHEQRQVQELLHGRGPFDEREIGSGVLEDHRLVDHRQLEVRGGIVDRNAPGFRDHDHEETGKREKIARMERHALLQQRS